MRMFCNVDIVYGDKWRDITLDVLLCGHFGPIMV